MRASARWNLVASQSTDDALRQFLASQGRGGKGELSRFVEEAIRARILALTVAQAKAQNAIDEALEWAQRT
ncbi:MAG TPA: ribbon-helix-helix domain-containing protein [Stellaceae bacterium]|nr:ribbon-helix-helix domain-containing protein [Stellaceae bacterium]